MGTVNPVRTTAFDVTWVPASPLALVKENGSGVVRAKYTGIVGSADVDVILSMITGNGVLSTP